MRTRHSLVARLSLLSAVTTSGLTGAALALLLVFGRQTVVQREMHELEQSAELYAAAVRQSLADARSTMETLAELTSPALDSRRIALAMLERSTLFSNLMFLSPSGQVELVLPSEQEGAVFRRDLAFASWFSKLAAEKRSVISDLFISTIDRRPAIVVAAPVRGPDGRFGGAWAGSLDLGRLSALYQLPAGADPNRAGYLTDRRGLVIAHQGTLRYVEEQIDFSSVPPVREALAGKRGTLRYVNPIEQLNKLGAFLPLEIAPGTPPWAVVYMVTAGYALGQLNALARMVLGLGVLLAVLTSGLTVLGLRRFLSPLGELVATAGRIGAGDFATSLVLRTGDELEELGGAFAGMAESLRHKDEQIRGQVAELVATNRELEAFSYSVSHDLRAPLRSIDGFSQALLEDCADVLPPEGREYLGFLRESSQQMGVLIDDLIQLSRLTRDEFHSEEVDLSALAEKAAAELCSHDRGRVVEFRIQPGVRAAGDPRLLWHVFDNLLGNAWKFTARNPEARIEFGARANGGETQYYVRDNGVGFDMAYASRLFSPFQRLHARSDFEGSGIGLATVQRVVRRHGGRVWAEAQPDRGATFYFTLEKAEKSE
jgi:signal transduction histidine kinase